MKRLVLACIFAISCYSQDFDAASIRPPTPVTTQCKGGPGADDPARLTCQNFPLSYLVMMAYNVRAYQFEGPGWMSSTRFDVQAAIPPGATAEQFRSMLQHMLAARFRLAVHMNKKEMDGYDLVVSRPSPDLKPSENQTPIAGLPLWRTPFAGPPVRARAQINGIRMPIEGLASLVSDRIGLPVADSTALHGFYDFKLNYTDDPAGAAGLSVDDDFASSIETALKDQLGLALVRKKVQVDIVIVDHSEKSPTDN